MRFGQAELTTLPKRRLVEWWRQAFSTVIAMVQTRPQLQTFDDFLAYAEAADGYYELTNGELVEMPPSLTTTYAAL